MIEQVEYDPYGRVRRTALGDFDHDGAIATADIFANLAAFNAPSPAADHDWDGAVAPSDIFAFLAHWFAADATPRDQLSSAGPGGHDNPIGYCGYYHDRETVGIMGDRNGGLYQVRHRVYDPHAGRWLQRDPAGFVDGMNLYEYVRGQVGALLDAFGLSCGDSEPTPTQSLFDRAKQWMHKQVQRVVDHIIDSTENPVIEEVTYVVAGIADTIHDTILDTASSGLDPESPDPGVQAGQQAAQQEMNHAARAGRDPSIVNVVMEMLADQSGANDLARAIYGYDSLEDRILTAEERLAAGLRGGGTTVLICVGCGRTVARTRGLGDVSHGGPLTPEQALTAAERWLGPGYREIGPGVFRSADNLRQFRMAPDDLAGNHGRIGPHVHFEAFDPEGPTGLRRPSENNHVPITQ